MAIALDTRWPGLLRDILYKYFLCCIPSTMANHLSLVRHLTVDVSILMGYPNAKNSVYWVIAPTSGFVGSERFMRSRTVFVGRYLPKSNGLVIMARATIGESLTLVVGTFRASSTTPPNVSKSRHELEETGRLVATSHSFFRTLTVQPKPLFRLPKPKEHGAWGMLYVSFFMAVCVAGSFDLKVWLLLATVTLLFFSQQPLTQLLSRRIGANFQQYRPTYWWLGFYWTSSAVLGAYLYSAYRLVHLPWFALMMALVAFAFVYHLKRNSVRTIAGELVGILGLTMTAPLAHYVALGQIRVTGFVLWVLAIVYFSSSIFYVKARVEQFLKSRSRPAPGKTPTDVACSSYHWGLLAVVAVPVVFNLLSPIVLLAFLPIILRGLWRFRGVQGRLNLKRIGLLEVAYSIFFALVIIWAMRTDLLPCGRNLSWPAHRRIADLLLSLALNR